MGEADRTRVLPPDPPEREWIMSWKWALALTLFFTVVYAVEGLAITVTAWVLAVVMFGLVVVGFVVFVRWLFTKA